MECELWPRLYVLVWRVRRRLRQKRVHFSDAVIVLVFLWGCLHDRPQSWACEPRNWKSTQLKPLRIPSDSTLSRRLRSPSVKFFMSALEESIRNTGDHGLLSFIDGKALTVGPCSKDPEARAGRAAKGMARGYKLHAIWSDRPFPEVWTVRPLNENESPVARTLIPQLCGGGYLLGDGQYDVNALHDLSYKHGHQLLTFPRVKNAKGLGHIRQSPHRLHAIEMRQRDFGRELLGSRRTIERHFGNVTSFGGGLAPLPNWVRRLERVRRWVWGKLIINAERIRVRKRLTA
jgi:hypothetical protein